jgi:hypothetical protein
MNVAMSVRQFDPQCIWFRDVKKNMIMDGNFTKLIYVHEWMTLIGVVLMIPVHILNIELVMGKKYIYYDCDLLEPLFTIEKEILDVYQQMFHCSYKNQNFKLQTQMGKKKYLSFPLNSVWSSGSSDWKKYTDQTLYIKLIGIWETSSEIGLTYKILFP